MQRVLVTGGAGFIGSHLVDALLALGSWEVRVLDNLSTGSLDNVRHCMADIEFLEGDVRDRDAVAKAVRGVDSVSHQAALPSVPRSIKDPVASNDVNVCGTVNVLDASRRAEVKRFVFASSSSVYGNSETLPKAESMATNPISPYAVSKLAGELYCRTFHMAYALETVALRYFNVFGPRQDPGSHYSGVLARFCVAAREGTSYTVFGDGLQSRDFTYIANVVDANLRALDCPEVGGDVVNVACGGRVSLLDVISVLNGLTGRNLPPVFEEARPGDVRHSQAAIGAAANLLGYAPIVDFETGLMRTFEWYGSQ